jgi:hypothetical protein
MASAKQRHNVLTLKDLQMLFETGQGMLIMRIPTPVWIRPLQLNGLPPAHLSR